MSSGTCWTMFPTKPWQQGTLCCPSDSLQKTTVNRIILLSSTFQNMTGRQRITDSRPDCPSGHMLKLSVAGAWPHREGDGAMHYHQDCAAGFDGFKPPLLPR